MRTERAVDVNRRARVRSRVYLTLTAVSLCATVVLTSAYFAESPAPPQPPAAIGVIPAAAMPEPTPAPTPPQAAEPTTPEAAPPGPLTLPAAVPVSVHAASVGMQSPLVQVGLNADGTIEVPVSYDTAAWYRLGPAPGSLGPAVIVGHVDSFKGPGVFFNLGALRPGAIIDVARADSTVAHFRVDAVNSYPKDHFPTATVYGPIDYAGLRVITCGGVFDRTTKSYESDTVVFASLVRG